MPDHHILIVHDSADLRQGHIPWEVGFLWGSSEEEGFCKVFIRKAISKAQPETKDTKAANHTVAEANKQAGGSGEQPLNEEDFWSLDEWQLIRWQQVDVSQGRQRKLIQDHF